MYLAEQKRLYGPRQRTKELQLYIKRTFFFILEEKYWERHGIYHDVHYLTIGNFRLDDGYEIDYEILSLKISNCKSKNVQFFDTIYLANGS